MIITVLINVIIAIIKLFIKKKSNNEYSNINDNNFNKN